MKSNFKNCFFIYTVTKIESISFLEDIEKEVIVHSILCKHQMHIPSMLKILSQVFTEEREYQQKEQLKRVLKFKKYDSFLKREVNSAACEMFHFEKSCREGSKCHRRCRG
mmetsp:Transcript_4501/g.5581  ORF Transcript_4501/g.5581 Transcript_4501/m.5581 type:complete len:110 (-) Transcript_4501:259-588(-)